MSKGPWKKESNIADAAEVFAWMLRGADPVGWGVPTDFEKAGWSFERYMAAHETLQEMAENLLVMP